MTIHQMKNDVVKVKQLGDDRYLKPCQGLGTLRLPVGHVYGFATG